MVKYIKTQSEGSAFMVYEETIGGIYIRHAISDNPTDKGFFLHIHDECEIYFFVSGDVDYLVEGTRYPLEENSLMIMRPSEIHTPRFTGPSRYERYALIFPVSIIKEFDPELSLLKPFFDRPLGRDNLFTKDEIDVEFVKTLFREMSEECDAYTKRVRLKTNLITLLGVLNRSFGEKSLIKHLPESQSEKIVSYVNEHIFEKLSVSEIAEHFFLSASQFSRVFKEATGVSPWDYILKKRLTAAKEMIRDGVPAQKVSAACGFSDYSVFYRAYIKNFGTPPKFKKK